jgi:peptidylprolyl isomerase
MLRMLSRTSMYRSGGALLAAGVISLPCGVAGAREPIPAARAFELPRAQTCVGKRSLAFSLRPVEGTTWKSATVNVDGKRFKRVRAGAATRAVQLNWLPRGRFTLTVTAQTRDKRTAKVERAYQTCIDTRPKVSVPAGDPPATLRLHDLANGSIRKAKRGDLVFVQYTTVTWSDGKEVDSSWSRGAQPFSFELGSGVVVPGFDQGIAGMKVGGRREIVVPPDLAYGAEGSGPIKPGETIVFVVDLVSVE